MRTDAHVYFIQAVTAGLIKIGIAGDVAARLRSLQSNTGDELRLLATQPGGQRREQELHTQFAAYRVRGEWFRPSAALLDLIHEQANSQLRKGRVLPASARSALFSPGVYFLLGRKFSGKTFLALQIACDLAAKRPSFAGIKSPDGDVLVVSLEDGPARIRQRLECIPGGPPCDNVVFTFEVPAPPSTELIEPENAIGQLETALDQLPTTRLVILDSWFALTEEWGRNTLNIRRLNWMGRQHGVSFLVLHTPEFDHGGHWGDPILSIIGAANACLLLRRDSRSRQADLIVASPDLRANAYLINQSGQTGFWQTTDPKPRSMPIEHRWWEL